MPKDAATTRRPPALQPTLLLESSVISLWPKRGWGWGAAFNKHMAQLQEKGKGSGEVLPPTKLHV